MRSPLFWAPQSATLLVVAAGLVARLGHPTEATMLFGAAAGYAVGCLVMAVLWRRELERKEAA